MLLQLEGVARQIGGRTLFRDVSLLVRAGDRIGLVGPNGAGKTTLLRIAGGDETPDAGEVSAPRHVRIGMLRQEIDPSLPHSVREEAATALAHLDALESEMRSLEQEMARAGNAGGAVSPEIAERYDRVATAFEHGGGFEREARVAAVLAGLGFDEEACVRPLSTFSGGWLMRIELAKLLLADPDVLLLDEPTNHLDLPSIQWFEETLDAFGGAVVTVSHDRTFLRRHVSRVAELDGFGRFSTYEGNYDRYLAQRDERRAQLLAKKANQDREIAQMERFVERFRAKATKARQAQSRIKALERLERIEVEPDRKRVVRLRIPAPPRSGQTVLTLDAIHKAYADTQVYSGIDLEIHRGDRVALVGPNGAGKSTLLRILSGSLDFDAGARTPGHNVQLAFYAQHQLESLSPSLTVLQELESVAQSADHSRLRGHLGAFLFSGDDVEKPVSVLSGGEKARLALAKMLLHPANFLVLDEPTNHLDIQACEVLEQALASFAGTLAFVSHDRAFINALATRVVEVRGGVLREFLGNYDEYLRRLDEPAPNTPAARSAKASPPPLDKRPKRRRKAAGPPENPVSGSENPASGSENPASGSGNPASGSGNPASPSENPDRPSGKAIRAQERQRKKARDQLGRKIARLEESIAGREQELEALGWRLGDPEVFRDAEQVREINAARDAAQSEVDDLYRDWERLSGELEALQDVLESDGDPTSPPRS